MENTLEMIAPAAEPRNIEPLKVRPTAVETPAADEVEPPAPADFPLASVYDLVIASVRVLGQDVPEPRQDDGQGELVAEDDHLSALAAPIEPQGTRGEPPAETWGPSPKRQLHNFLRSSGLDYWDQVPLVVEILAMLAGKQPVEGKTFEPHEQVRFAFMGALKAGADNIGVYARGMIKNHFIGDRFNPLPDPEAKARARAGPDRAELARQEAELKRAKAEEAARQASELEGQKARWEALPESWREQTRAVVRARYPGLLRLPMQFCYAVMDEHSGTVAASVPVEPVIPPACVVEAGPSEAEPAASVAAGPPPVVEPESILAVESSRRAADPRRVAGPGGPSRIELPPADSLPSALDRRRSRFQDLNDPTPAATAAPIDAFEAERARMLAHFARRPRDSPEVVEPPVAAVEDLDDIVIDPPPPSESRPGVFRWLRSFVGCLGIFRSERGPA